MKCKHCDGTGKSNMWKDDDFADCMYCGGTGKVEQTNEEYIKSCTTEQLAEELLAWWFTGANTYSQFGLFKWEIDEAKEKIEEWLKQPHTSKE